MVFCETKSIVIYLRGVCLEFRQVIKKKKNPKQKQQRQHKIQLTRPHPQGKMYLHQINVLFYFPDEIRPWHKNNKINKIKEIKTVALIGRSCRDSSSKTFLSRSFKLRFFFFFLHLSAENLFNALLLLISQ